MADDNPTVSLTKLSSIEISSCSSLNKPFRAYVLTSDVFFPAHSSCFSIMGPHITLDCAGHSILGVSGGKGIDIRATGASILNCHVDVNATIAGENIAIYASDIAGVSIVNVSTSNSYKGLLFENVQHSSVFGFYSEHDYKSIDLFGSSYNSFFDIVAFNPLDMGVHLHSSDHNRFENVDVQGSQYGVYLRLGSSENLFKNLYSHHNLLRGVVLTLAGGHNEFIDSIFDHNQYGTKINGGPYTRFVNVTFSNSEVQHVFSASSSNKGLTFVETRFIDGDYLPEYDLHVGNGILDGLLIQNTKINRYAVLEGLTSFMYEERLFGKIVFNNLPPGTGSSLSTDLAVFFNMAEIRADENRGLDSPAIITLYAMPSNFTNPRIYKDGLLCNDCKSLGDLNGTVVSFSVPGAGKYWIAEY